jgi:hypothetical protein
MYLSSEISLDYDDFFKIVQTFNAKSSISNALGAKMKLIRWKKDMPIAINNIILLSNAEFQKHIAIKNSLDEIYEEETIKEVESKLNSLKNN